LNRRFFHFQSNNGASFLSTPFSSLGAGESRIGGNRPVIGRNTNVKFIPLNQAGLGHHLELFGCCAKLIPQKL
jgi:hypothetical protein